MSYDLASLVEDLRASYGHDASNEAVGLIIAARDRGMMPEAGVFASAAIMLCRSVGTPPATAA